MEEIERMRYELELDAPLLMRNGTYGIYRVLEAVGVVGIAAYFWLLTGKWGQTLGKLALRTQVVNSRGTVPGLGPAALRELLPMVLIIVLVIGGLLFIWVGVGLIALLAPGLVLIIMVAGLLGFLGMMARDDRTQGWHDKLARTYLVKKPGT